MDSGSSHRTLVIQVHRGQLSELEAAGSEEMVLSDVIDLDEVDNVRRFGTAGVTTPWRQFTGGEDSLALPFYSGSINPQRWASTLQPREQEK